MFWCDQISFAKRDSKPHSLLSREAGGAGSSRACRNGLIATKHPVIVHRPGFFSSSILSFSVLSRVLNPNMESKFAAS